MSKNLGIAYSAKSKKRYAKGGQIPPSAKTESRPAPESKGQSEVSRNSGDKPAHMDRATDTPERRQASKGMKTTPIKHPTMQQSPVFKMKLRDEEDHLETSDATKMAEGGKINDLESMDKAEDDGEPPNLDAMQKAADELKEEADPDAMNDHMTMLAKGGEVENDHEDSIAAAIMARRDRLHEEIDSGAHDLDSAVKMAEGGQVDIDENGMEEPNDFYSLNEDAALKENYDSDLEDVSQPMDSNEHGHEIDEDDHDMVDKIRKGMKSKRQFKGK